MKSAVFTQHDSDELRDQVSDETGLDCTADLFDPNTNKYRKNRDVARQEQKQETDVNWILSRFGLGASKQVQYGDTTGLELDLTRAYSLMHEIDQAMDKLSPAMRKEFPDRETLVLAIANGDFERKAKELEEAAKVPPVAPTPETPPA